MRDRLHLLLLHLYRRLPVGVRRRLVRAISPSYTVGAMCYIERADGALLLVRHSYRHRWGVPGGLVQRGEDSRRAATREVYEETAVRIELVGEAAVVVDPSPQRVDVVYRARLAETHIVAPVASSPEIAEVGWFAPDQLPELQHETMQALVALARSASTPQARPLVVDPSGPVPRSDAV